MKRIHVILMALLSLTVLADNEKLSLNNGQKWLANEETHVGMTEIETLVDQAGTLTHEILVAKLEKQIQTIITKCSMKGESHDQLHKVLHPIITKVGALKEAATSEDQKAILENLKHLTKTYFTYFKYAKDHR